MLFQAKEGLLLSFPNSPLLNLRWKEGSQLPESPPTLHFLSRPTYRHRPHVCVGGQASHLDSVSVSIKAEQTKSSLGTHGAFLALSFMYFLGKLNTLKEAARWRPLQGVN